MANKLYEETNIQAIANAIRGKNGSSDTYTVAQMAQAIADIPTGGSITVSNGTLESIKAGSGTLTANQFIQVEKSFTHPVNSFYASNGSSVNLHKISDNNILVLSLGNGYLYYTFININNATDTLTFSPSSITPINVSVGRSYYNQLCSFLEGDKVILLMSYPNKGIGAAVLTLNGTTLTLDTTSALITESNIGYNYNFCAMKADTGKYVIAYSKSSSHYLYGAVVEISGTTITMGTETQLSSVKNSSQYICGNTLDTDKIFLRFTGDTSYRAYALILTISGTTITIGTATQLTSDTYVYYMSLGKISSTKIILGWNRSSNQHIAFAPITISGDTITVGTFSNIIPNKITSSFTMTDFENSKSIIGYQYQSTPSRAWIAVISENNGTISLVSTTEMTTKSDSTQGAKGIFYNSTGILGHTHYAGSIPKELFMNLQLNNGELSQSLRINTATSGIDGLLISEATTSTTGNVYLLNT